MHVDMDTGMYIDIDIDTDIDTDMNPEKGHILDQQRDVVVVFWA